MGSCVTPREIRRVHNEKPADHLIGGLIKHSSRNATEDVKKTG